MSKRTLTDLSPEELEATLEAYITREDDEMPPSAFFETLARIEAEQTRTAPLIEIEQEVVAGELRLSVAPTSPTPAVVRGNEIVLDDGTRILLRLKGIEAVA